MVGTYSEPTVLWRLVDARQDHIEARATILPGSPTTLLWLVGEVLQRADNFDECSAALASADRLRIALIEQGWKEKPD